MFIYTVINWLDSDHCSLPGARDENRIEDITMLGCWGSNCVLLVWSVCQWQLLCVCWADWMLAVEAGTSCCSASTEDGDPATASSPLPTLAGATSLARIPPYTSIHTLPIIANSAHKLFGTFPIWTAKSELFMVPFLRKALSLALIAYPKVNRCTWEFWIRFPFFIFWGIIT